MTDRDFRADVIASLKAQRKVRLSQGLPVDDVETSLRGYGVTFDAPALENKQETPAQQTVTPASSETAAAPTAPAKAAAPASAPAKKAAAKAAPRPADKAASAPSPSGAAAAAAGAKQDGSTAPSKDAG